MTPTSTGHASLVDPPPVMTHSSTGHASLVDLPPAITPTRTGLGRDFSNSAKIHTDGDEAKYSGRDDSFTYKLAVFHDNCVRVDVPPEAKMKALPTTLKGPALDYYSSNNGISGTAMNSDQVCDSIRMTWMKWDKTQDEMDETRIGVG